MTANPNRDLRFCRTCNARDRITFDRRCSVCGQHPDIEPVRDDDDRWGDGS